MTVVGGDCETASLGGYLSGGRYGVLTSRHGLAVDQVLEMEVVLPDGCIVMANDYQDQDLF